MPQASERVQWCDIVGRALFFFHVFSGTHQGHAINTGEVHHSLPVLLHAPRSGFGVLYFFFYCTRIVPGR